MTRVLAHFPLQILGKISGDYENDCASIYLGSIL